MSDALYAVLSHWRALNFFLRVRVRYLEVWTRSELHTPLGTSHLYPYEVPDFVVGVVRRILRTVQDSSTAR